MSKAAELAALIGSQTALVKQEPDYQWCDAVGTAGTQRCINEWYYSCDRFELASTSMVVT